MTRFCAISAAKKKKKEPKRPKCRQCADRLKLKKNERKKSEMCGYGRAEENVQTQSHHNCSCCFYVPTALGFRNHTARTSRSSATKKKKKKKKKKRKKKKEKKRNNTEKKYDMCASINKQ